MTHRLSFYRQQRKDGGIRTGIDIEDENVFHHFQPGEDDTDPALVWYVDVRCEGAKLPRDAEKARKWLLTNAGPIRAGLTQLADELKGGMDPNLWPLLWQIPKPPAGVKVTIAVSAARRTAGLTIAEQLTDIANNWERRIQDFPAVEPLNR